MVYNHLLFYGSNLDIVKVILYLLNYDDLKLLLSFVNMEGVFLVQKGC